MTAMGLRCGEAIELSIVLLLGGDRLHGPKVTVEVQVLEGECMRGRGGMGAGEGGVTHDDGLVPPEDVLRGEVQEQFGFSVIQLAGHNVSPAEDKVRASQATEEGRRWTSCL